MSNNPNKKRSFSLNSLIYNDKYLIVVSLLLAVLVWIGTSISMGTDESRTLSINVPIELGDKVSDQLGVQYYPLQDTVELEVTITGAKYVIGQVKQDDLNVKFDTSSVKRTGSQSVPIIVTSKSKYLDYSVSSVYPNSIDCYFDVNSSKSLDIDVLYDSDNVADGYMFGKPVLSEDRIYVSGPKTYIDRIESAYVQMNFGDAVDLTEPVNQKCSILFRGTGIDTDYVNIYTNAKDEERLSDVSVTLPILKLQTVPVTTTFTGQPAVLPEGAVEVQYSISEIRGGILDSADVSAADVGTIDYSQLTVGQNVFNFELSSASGIAFIDDSDTVTATVTVADSYKENSIQISPRNVIIENAPQGKNVTVESLSQSTITVVAPKSANISKGNLVVECDLTGVKKSGTYELQFTITNHRDSWVYGTYTCDVVID